MCGTWEGCHWEGGNRGPVTALIQPGGGAGGQPGGGAAAHLHDPHDRLAGGEAEAEAVLAAGWQAAFPGLGGAAEPGGEFAPGWLARELGAAVARNRLVRDGWQAMHCAEWLDLSTMPRDLAQAVGVSVGGGARGAGPLGPLGVCISGVVDIPFQRGRGAVVAAARAGAVAAAARAGQSMERWVSLVQLCFLLGIHRALHGAAGHADYGGGGGLGGGEEEPNLLAGIR
jgi:hypothetical protein